MKVGRMRRRGTAVSTLEHLLLVAGIFTAAAANAHHSPASFDTTKSVTITGTVKKFEWFNPHVYITIVEAIGDGKNVEWEIESFAPLILRRMGWTPETLHVGDAITVTGSPSRKADSKALLGGTIKRADSTLLNSAMIAKGFAPTKDAPKFVAQGLVGIWEAETTVQVITQFAFPNVNQMTSDGAELFARFDEKTMSPGINCIPPTAPGSMVMPGAKQISAGDGVIYIRDELDGAQRTVHLNATSHEGAIPSLQGHSIGRWDGKALVIDTTLFAFHGAGNGIGLPSSTAKHLVERFTPSADGTSLDYRFEVTDATYLKAPRTADIKWVFRPDMKFAPEPCNLESARRFIKH